MNLVVGEVGQMPSTRAAALERVIIRSPPKEADELRIISGVLFLSQYSSLHRLYPVETLIQRVAPTLKLDQFLYYTDPQGAPVAFCNWAWLNASVLKEVLTTGRDLCADEFACGGLPFFYEFLAPFGHCRKVVRVLRNLPFLKGRCIPAIRGEVYRDDPYLPRIQYFQF